MNDQYLVKKVIGLLLSGSSSLLKDVQNGNITITIKDGQIVLSRKGKIHGQVSVPLPSADKVIDSLSEIGGSLLK